MGSLGGGVDNMRSSCARPSKSFVILNNVDRTRDPPHLRLMGSVVARGIYESIRCDGSGSAGTCGILRGY